MFCRRIEPATGREKPTINNLKMKNENVALMIKALGVSVRCQ
jgi:hypothetical protein